MQLVSSNLTMLNARGLRDPSKCTRLLGKLSNLSMNVAAVQETHFTCAVDCRVLEDDYFVILGMLKTEKTEAELGSLC